MPRRPANNTLVLSKPLHLIFLCIKDLDQAKDNYLTITAGHWVHLFLVNAAEGAIIAAALHGAEAEAEAYLLWEAWLPAPRAF